VNPAGHILRGGMVPVLSVHYSHILFSQDGMHLKSSKMRIMLNLFLIISAFLAQFNKFVVFV
jgi:hypothetical protein